MIPFESTYYFGSAVFLIVEFNYELYEMVLPCISAR